MCLCAAFFFSGRGRHTSCLSDWSSDVCSSDLPMSTDGGSRRTGLGDSSGSKRCRRLRLRCGRSEERRVGKEFRSRWSPYHEKKKRGEANLDREGGASTVLR